MAESSNESEMHVSFVHDMIKSLADEIAELLDLDGSESKGQIMNDLFENGRQSLVNYEEDIICERYKDVMNGSENKLMFLLKKYYRQKWEVQYGKSHPWFISFIEQYQNGECHDIYERVLTHAAEYGDKHTETCRVLSIVLQFLFDTIDDECWTKTKLFDDKYLKEQPIFDSQYLRETENSDDQFLKEISICDGLWYAISNDGLKSITKYSDYIVPDVMHEQLNKSQSVLFQALREYYRTQLFPLLKENRILYRQELYDLALDNVAEHGWLNGIQAIQQRVAPKHYKKLLENINSVLQKRKAQANQALEQQEQNTEQEAQVGNKNAKKKEESKTLKAQGQNEDPNGQYKSKKLEKEGENKESNREEEDKEQKQQATSNSQGINTCSENKHTKANLTEAAAACNQEPDEERKPNKTNDLDNSSKTTSEDEQDDIVPRTPLKNNKIFIAGLPKTMAKKHLLSALSRTFSSIGQIKIDKKTKEPWIDLPRQKDDKSKLSGTAWITFEEEESMIKAIKTYNREPEQIFIKKRKNIIIVYVSEQCVPVFNDARIYVSEARMKNDRAKPEPPAQPIQQSPGNVHTPEKKDLYSNTSG
ncbi:unnamed protein product [Rotaria sp. Silwood2]|nr:unnamed protein product [Rotaria sp. Silwood2]